VREAEDRHGRRVIATAAFQAQKPVFDDIYPADAVDLANLVEGAEEVDRVCVFTLRSDELRRDALLEVNRDVGGLVRGLPGVIGHDPHVVRRWVGWVFKDACMKTSYQRLSVWATTGYWIMFGLPTCLVAAVCL